MVRVVVENKLFGRHLLELLKPKHQVQLLTVEEFHQTTVEAGDVVVCELPELAWCDYKLAKVLREQRQVVIAMGFQSSVHIPILQRDFGTRYFVTENSGPEDLLLILNSIGSDRFNAEDSIPTFDHTSINNQLSQAEYDVLYWLCRDSSSKQIAQFLGKSQRTVENIRYKLSRKLDVHSTVGLVKWAYDNKVVFPVLEDEFYEITLQNDNKD
ncbi:helix-turn-helix transcriptional regulator [Salibacter halophilus]|uniref:Response regulator transcription factor n=1 Tax=Salibacter halophilus TaxID=1803916 RepID=A0A6N6MAR3_9FLAO|nr:LuxR C-terminal-related transcriptional regulator [Salibacter halophilus]KAB1065926.1 response regulator transcription factor [Salibacter halophilus]